VITSPQCYFSSIICVSDDESSSRLPRFCAPVIFCFDTGSIILGCRYPTDSRLWPLKPSLCPWQASFIWYTYNTFSDRSFSGSGHRVWNSLPADLWLKIQFSSFKQQLRTILISCQKPRHIVSVCIVSSSLKCYCIHTCTYLLTYCGFMTLAVVVGDIPLHQLFQSKVIVYVCITNDWWQWCEVQRWLVSIIQLC